MKVLDEKTKAQTVFEIDQGSGYAYIMSNKKVADMIGIDEYIARETTEEWELPQDHKSNTLEDLYSIMLVRAKLVQTLKRHARQPSEPQETNHRTGKGNGKTGTEKERRKPVQQEG